MLQEVMVDGQEASASSVSTRRRGRPKGSKNRHVGEIVEDRLRRKKRVDYRAFLYDLSGEEIAFMVQEQSQISAPGPDEKVAQEDFEMVETEFSRKVEIQVGDNQEWDASEEILVNEEIVSKHEDEQVVMESAFYELMPITEDEEFVLVGPECVEAV